MKLMKFVEFGSSGALLMSRFHQFVAGKRGRGGGSGPPIVADAQGEMSEEVCAMARAHSALQDRDDTARSRTAMRAMRGERMFQGAAGATRRWSPGWISASASSPFHWRMLSMLVWFFVAMR